MLILDIRRRDGSVRKLWMRPGDHLRFGRSNQADVWIDGDDTIHDLHFEISETEGMWHVRSLGQARVGVNGNDGHLQTLRDGDLIIAGQTEVLVAIEGAKADRAVEEPKPAAPAAPHRPLDAVATPLESGAVQVRILMNDDSAATVIKRIAQGRNVYGLVNEKRFGGPVPDTSKLGDDLFLFAPPEVRQTDSMHVVTFPTPEIALLQLFAHSRKDASMLVTTELSPRDLVERQRLVWAWFARPGIIRQQMQHGSKMLADRILYGPANIITAGRAGQVDVFTTAAQAQALLAELKAE